MQKAEASDFPASAFTFKWNYRFTALTLPAPVPSFSQDDERTDATLTNGIHWVVKESSPMFAEYKNERLLYYQQDLDKKRPENVKDADWIELKKYAVAQLLQENGGLSEDHTSGDKGCAVGIPQYNACEHAKMNAKQFLTKYPAWQDWRYQLEQMSDMVLKRWQIYNGNIFRVIVHHNCPACAKRNADSKSGYFRIEVSQRLKEITLL